MLEMSVPKILLIEEVRFCGGGFEPLVGWADIIAFADDVRARPSPTTALSALSVARLKLFRLITMTLEFSLFPFLINWQNDEGAVTYRVKHGLAH